MVLINMDFPTSCDRCPLFMQISDLCAYCMATRMPIRFGEVDMRDILCPLVEVEEKEIQVRTSHVSWETRKVYVKKERQRDDNTGGV